MTLDRRSSSTGLYDVNGGHEGALVRVAWRQCGRRGACYCEPCGQELGIQEPLREQAARKFRCFIVRPRAP